MYYIRNDNILAWRLPYIIFVFILRQYTGVDLWFREGGVFSGRCMGWKLLFYNYLFSDNGMSLFAVIQENMYKFHMKY